MMFQVKRCRSARRTPLTVASQAVARILLTVTLASCQNSSARLRRCGCLRYGYPGRQQDWNCDDLGHLQIETFRLESSDDRSAPASERTWMASMLSMRLEGTCRSEIQPAFGAAGANETDGRG
jgi:hypothetical protein